MQSSIAALLLMAAMMDRPRPRASSLPKRLTRGQIMGAMGRVMGRARACFNRYKKPGTYTVRVTVNGATGRASASASGSSGHSRPISVSRLWAWPDSTAR